jgi:hypothetical protein
MDKVNRKNSRAVLMLNKYQNINTESFNGIFGDFICHFFRLLKVISDGMAFNPKKLPHCFLRQPNGFVFYKNLNIHFARCGSENDKIRGVF